MSGLHGERRPVCAVAVGEQQRALTGAYVAAVDRVAQVDEVVAGQGVAAARIR